MNSKELLVALLTSVHTTAQSSDAVPTVARHADVA